MTLKMTPEQVRAHFSIPEMENCYLLLCDGGPVTVQSQQVRALNLLCALAADPKSDNKIEGKRIAVIGGGAAGITFAAGAASVGGRVTLFEKSPQLLHMQLGSWHRPLHPEIFTWPEDTAYRPVSHLPQLGWTTGRAHDVADTLLAQFAGICTRLEAQKPQFCQPRVCLGTAVQVTPDKRVIPHDMSDPFDLVVLAVGFGIEDLPYPLPWNSYWRVDPLDQTLLDKDASTPTIVVVGTGDGALIEIIRSCIRSFDQGALLDCILYATLDNEILDKVKEIEGKSEEKRFDLYYGLDSPAVAEILLDNLRETKVHWLMREDKPFRQFSLPINRFIVSQIVALQDRGEIRKRLSHTRGKLIELVPRAEILDVKPADKGYRVAYFKKGAPRSVLCDNAIVRFGAERDEVRPDERDETKPATKGLLRGIGRALAPSGEREKILEGIQKHRDDLNKENNLHVCCRMPIWAPRSPFVDQLKAFDPRSAVADGTMKEAPVLHAHFVKGFLPKPDSNYEYPVYRIKAWLEGLPEPKVEGEGRQELRGALRVTYDLHPENGRPISRAAFGPRHEIWLNTHSNYKVRARTNDGREWDLGWVHDALEREGTKATVVKLDNGREREFDDALRDVQTTRKQKGDAIYAGRLQI